MSRETHTITRGEITFEVTKDEIALNIQMNLEEIRSLSVRINELHRQVRRYKEDLRLIKEREKK